MNVPEQEPEPAVAKRKSKWPKVEREMLRQYVEEFRGADAAARKLLLTSTVLPKYWALGDNKNLTREQQKYRRREIKEWYHNVARRNGLRTRFSFGNTVTLKRVTAHRMAERIEDVVRNLSGVEPGDPGYLPFYQKGLSKVFNDLTPEELKEIKNEQKEWMTKKYPEEVQRKTATKQGERVISQCDEVRLREMGMRSITWEFHVNTKGQLVFACHDNNENIGDRPVKRLADMFKDIHEEYEQAFSAYAKYVFEIDQGQEGEDQLPTRRNVRSALVLEVSPDGYPILPPQNIHSGDVDENLDEMRRLVRAFLCQNYNLASGRTSGKVPFGKLALDNASFVDPKYRPQGVTLQDPSILKRHELEACLKFWRARQAVLPPSEVFRWMGFLTGNGNAKEIAPALYPLVSLPAIPRKRAPAPRKKAKKKGRAKAIEPDVETEEMPEGDQDPIVISGDRTEQLQPRELNIGSLEDDRTPPMNPLELEDFLRGENALQPFDEQFLDPNVNIFDTGTLNDMSASGLFHTNAFGSSSSDTNAIGHQSLWIPPLPCQDMCAPATKYTNQAYQSSHEFSQQLYLPPSTYDIDSPMPGHPMVTPNQSGMHTGVGQWPSGPIPHQTANMSALAPDNFTFPPFSGPIVGRDTNPLTELGPSISPAKRSLLNASIAGGQSILPPRARPRPVEPRTTSIISGDVPDSHFAHRRAQRMGGNGGHHNFILGAGDMSPDETSNSDTSQSAAQLGRKRALSTSAEEGRTQGSNRYTGSIPHTSPPVTSSATYNVPSVDVRRSPHSALVTGESPIIRATTLGQPSLGPSLDVGPVHTATIPPSMGDTSAPAGPDTIGSMPQTSVPLNTTHLSQAEPKHHALTKSNKGRKKIVPPPPVPTEGPVALKRSSRVSKAPRANALLDVIEAGLLAKVNKRTR